jgi:hypothetical protein
VLALALSARGRFGGAKRRTALAAKYDLVVQTNSFPSPGT